MNGHAHAARQTHKRWRFRVLVLVHLLIAAHVAHFVVAGSTLSPLEPSEAMYAIELRVLNAGTIFAALMLLGTMLFGRFFCGWGCHLIALQDLCGWLLRRAGLRPRLFRSRLLAMVPIAVALYMFAWPAAMRFLWPEPSGARPGWTLRVTTHAFWATFPGPAVAVLTLLACGFGVVYFLGAKGFCTYACPYGAFFGVASRLSPLAVVVSDACRQCGRCTEACTSNVRVSAEVARHGRVVDPGCMKCGDCIDSCPNGALRFGLAAPSLLVIGRRQKTRYDVGVGTDVALAAVTLASILALRGLYDAVPLLLSVALAVMTAFGVAKLASSFRAPHGSLPGLTLKSNGRAKAAGWSRLLGFGLWVAFLVHSGVVQWDRAWGRRCLQQTQVTKEELFSGRVPAVLSVAHQRALEATRRHFDRADRWGLAGVVEVKVGLSWVAMLGGDMARAEAFLREAIRLRPGQRQLYQELAEFLLWRHRPRDAGEVLQAWLAAREPGAVEPRMAR